jgi:hypothetical protein
MASSSYLPSNFFVLFLVLLLIHVSPAAAFGAGNIGTHPLLRSETGILTSHSIYFQN